MPVCTFCKNSYEFPKGTTVVQKDSTVRYLCSSKCRKNMEMGRLNKKVKWIRKSDVVKAEKAKKDEAYKATQEALKAAK
jgi:ribosomal protein L24E